jgi:hypothetical protein
MESDVHPLSPPPHVLPDPSNYLLKFPVNGLPRFPNGLLWREICLQNFLLRLSLKVPGKWAPLHVPQQGPYGEKSFISGANGLFIHSLISVGILSMEPSHKKKEKIFGHCPWSPTWTEDLHTMGCGLVSQGDHLRHCSLYPSAMQPSARYFHVGLGRPQPR